MTFATGVDLAAGAGATEGTDGLLNVASSAHLQRSAFSTVPSGAMIFPQSGQTTSVSMAGCFPPSECSRTRRDVCGPQIVRTDDAVILAPFHPPGEGHFDEPGG